MFRTDAVDTPKALDESYWVPMQIIVDERIAVLHVQTCTQDIGCDQGLDFRLAFAQFVFRVGFGGKAPYYSG